MDQRDGLTKVLINLKYPPLCREVRYKVFKSFYEGEDNRKAVLFNKLEAYCREIRKDGLR